MIFTKFMNFSSKPTGRMEDVQKENKRKEQIKFVLKERMKPEFHKRIDLISGRELVNVLETKQGAIYMLPEKLSVSGRTEIHRLN